VRASQKKARGVPLLSESVFQGSSGVMTLDGQPGPFLLLHRETLCRSCVHRSCKGASVSQLPAPGAKSGLLSDPLRAEEVIRPQYEVLRYSNGHVLVMRLPFVRPGAVEGERIARGKTMTFWANMINRVSGACKASFEDLQDHI
jgi:hypothetical protein